MAYTAEKKQEIVKGFCRLVAAGYSIKRACASEGMPAESTIMLWLFEDDDFSEQYARARERRADARAERIDDLCEEIKSGTLKPDAARVIIEAEKWQAGKENSKRYGDKIHLDGDMNVNMSDEQLDARLAKLLGKAGAAGALGGEGSA